MKKLIAFYLCLLSISLSASDSERESASSSSSWISSRASSSHFAADFELAELYRQKTCKRQEKKLAKRRVLVIDGGGVRGAFAARALQEIEFKTGKSIHELFQGGITGTSTGAFIALALTTPTHFDVKSGEWRDGPYPAEDIVNFYRTESPNFFSSWSADNCLGNLPNCSGGICSTSYAIMKSLLTCFGCFGCFKNCGGLCGPRYSNAPLKSSLTQLLRDHRLSDAIVPVQTVAYNIEQGSHTYFSSLDATENDRKNYQMLDVALCSSAAPTYFPAVTVGSPDTKLERKVCVDGGIMENSPVLAALRMASEAHQDIDVAEFTIVSIGTCSKVSPSRVNPLARGGKLTWARYLAHTMISATAEASNHNLRKLLSPDRRRNPLLSQYHRIQAPIDQEHYALDDPSQVEYLISRFEHLREDSESIGFLLDSLPGGRLYNLSLSNMLERA